MKKSGFRVALFFLSFCEVSAEIFIRSQIGPGEFLGASRLFMEKR